MKAVRYKYSNSVIDKKWGNNMNGDDYFLNGLKRSRIKYGDSRKRDRKRTFWLVEK